ncbi:MAG: NADH dehydrogenase subunit [candidate division Zixibacteria bacterium]|nr:NADH dehydrogenase subunit [candidate division Zixibacteria bacterium]
MTTPIADSAFDAGVVGAGGAGFPTHVKLRAKAEYLLINGAECEPLLHKDKELLKRFAPDVIQGAILAAEAIGANRIICGIKETYHDVIHAVEQAVEGTGVELKLFGNFYPSGDEYVVVWECTGRLIPPAGLPVHVGCVVSNVETLYNVALAARDGAPVTDSFLTVNGLVGEPLSLRVPVGTPIRDVVALTGFVPSNDPAVLDGGAMMGHLRTDLSLPVTKTTGGYIVLPNDHYLVRRRSMTKTDMHRKGHSACDQCTYCTEFCPRYLLGYEIEPHKVMRSLLFAGQQNEEYWSKWGQLCCECNLCSLYACPEDLDPKDACVWSKEVLRESDAPPPEWVQPERPHAFSEHRKLPLSKLVRRLGLEKYDLPAPWTDTFVEPERVTIPLKQHIGRACEPIVSTGERVERGQPIGRIPEGELGAPVHASITGQVTAVGESITIERT